MGVTQQLNVNDSLSPQSGTPTPTRSPSPAPTITQRGADASIDKSSVRYQTRKQASLSSLMPQ